MFSSIRNRLIALSGLPLTAVIFIFAILIWTKYQQVQEINELEPVTQLGSHIGALIHETQKERGISANYLSAPSNRHNATLLKQRNQTQLKTLELNQFIKNFDATLYDKEFQSSFSKAKSATTKIAAFQTQIDNNEVSVNDVIVFYSHLNDMWLKLIQHSTRLTSNTAISVQRSAYYNFLQGKDAVGVERAIMSHVFSADNFKTGEYGQFQTLLAMQNTYFDEFRSLAMPNQIRFFDKIMQDSSILEVERMQKIALIKGEPNEKPGLLFALYEGFGYGGLIHHFKNYLLRQDEKYKLKFEKSRIQILDIISLLNQLSETSEEEKLQLKIIRDTTESYANQMQLITRLISEGNNTNQIDREVKIDDKPALQAIHTFIKKSRYGNFDVDSEYWFETITKKIDLLKAIENQISSDILDYGVKLKQNSREALFGYLFLAFIIVFLVVFTAIRIAYHIKKPLIQAIEFADRISNNNFTEKLEPTSKGELGELGHALNKMSFNLQETLKELENNEQVIRASMVEAQSATRAKSEFLASMSHEIRTPMNGVIGMTALLLKTALSQKQQNYAQTAMTSAESLLVLINDILDFSKIEAGKLSLEEVPFDLQQLIDEIAELMSIKCYEKDIEMLLRFRPETSRFVFGDPGRIRQIILNLLSNAIKFTHEGHVLLSVKSSTSLDGLISFQITVEDTGIGISNDKLDVVFNKFDQADGSTTRKYGGTGLGLAISKQLSYLMSGDIHLESCKGKGSTFTFTMKLRENADIEKSPVGIVDDYLSLKNLKILIVDDMKIARKIIKEQLAGISTNVETVRSGEEAIEKLVSAQDTDAEFDIVITDYRMPEMNGEMLAQIIQDKKLLPNGILIFVTSSPRKGDSQRFKNLGFSGYLTKPTSSSEIPNMLSVIWQAKQAGKVLPLVTRYTIEKSKTLQTQSKILKNTHILLVEDNYINQMVATEMLNLFGCAVTPAGNGVEAVDIYSKFTFDLVFMDCLMPEMDGFEATDRIRQFEKKQHSKPTPIIAFTANAMKGDREKCLNSGMDGYLSKPINEDSLKNILIEWLPDKITDIPLIDTANNEKPEEKYDHLTALNFTIFNKLKTLFGDKFPAAVNQFKLSSKNNMNKAMKAIEMEDAALLELSAHSLKSSNRQFGAMQLGAIAEEIEQCAKGKKFEAAKEQIDTFVACRQDVISLMNNEISLRD